MVVTHENMCFVFSIYLPSFNFIIRGFCGWMVKLIDFWQQV
jgi:hypothetical protein